MAPTQQKRRCYVNPVCDEAHHRPARLTSSHTFVYGWLTTWAPFGSEAQIRAPGARAADGGSFRCVFGVLQRRSECQSRGPADQLVLACPGGFRLRGETPVAAERWT